jgi:hypothetical protein
MIGSRPIALLIVVAMTVASCGRPPNQTPGPSLELTTAPSASPPAERSSQSLIATDLAAGAIDAGTALTYRAWALYFDARLPERYWGNGAMVADASLHREIEAALPTVSADQRAELERYVLRPTDPRSPFGPRPGQATAALQGVPAIGADDPGSQCVAPNAWKSKDWLAGASPDSGVRAWICAPTQAAADADLDVVLQAVDDLWPNMTIAEPNGMGLPISDASAGGNNGDGGLLDIYMLDFGQCGPRGGPCLTALSPHPWSDRGYAWPAQPCGVAGFPAKACSGYIEIARSWLDHPEFKAVVGHELFHVLQFAHTASFTGTWFAEASGTWAGWHYSRTEFEPHAGALFDDWQNDNHSLLQYDTEHEPQYEAWVWSLFQDVEQGPAAIYQAWSAIEKASSFDSYNAAISQQLPFAERFRDFAVRNVNPREYIATEQPQTGLEQDRWTVSSDPDVYWLAAGAPHVLHADGAISLGKSNHDLTALPLQSQIDRYTITGGNVRQITIDLTTLGHAANADLDVLGRIGRPAGAATTDATRWRRVRAAGGQAILCRDRALDNFDLLYVVVSNHAFEQDQTKSGLTGSYTVEAKDTCDLPTAYDVTFSGTNDDGDAWSGTATYKLVPVSDGDCSFVEEEGTHVQYCYRATGGQFTWTYKGQSLSQTMKVPDNDSGEILLFIAGLPKYTMTYTGNLIPSCGRYNLPTADDPFHDACDQVPAWLHMSGPHPIPAHYTLAGTYTANPDTNPQTWTWSATPTFNP